MSVGERYARVDERAGGELRAGLFGCRFEGEVGEGGGGGVGREGDVVEVGGGAEDAAYDEVGGGGGVLGERG